MGLLREIITIFELLYKEGEKEWLDESRFLNALNLLYEKFEAGEINNKEYYEQEDMILEQLHRIRQYKREHSIESD